MHDTVLSIEAFLADGSQHRFGPVAQCGNAKFAALQDDLLALGTREAAEIDARFPKVMRRVGGHNTDALVPKDTPNNLAHLLVRSEGTLAYSTAIDLRLWPILTEKVLGVCHFPTFHQTMDAAQHLVKLNPQGAELVDDTMIARARNIPVFRDTIQEFVTGKPDALLLVEFAEEDTSTHPQKLKDLKALLGDLGFSWSKTGKHWDGVTAVPDPSMQARISDLRSSGLNIMMSMKADGKPVSFVEDCAVELPGLAAYTAGPTELFEKHGARGTWYAHASVGCLHVRPVMNLKLDQDPTRCRANTVRLAISGQLGPDALTSDPMTDTMKLCVSCKGCKRECPTDVDMARMKIEVQSARNAKVRLGLHDRLVADLPRYACWAARVPFVMNLRNSVPGLARLTERLTGLTATRDLPKWHARPFRDTEIAASAAPQAALFADTFNRHFEPETLRAAAKVLEAANVPVTVATAPKGERPLCCGRTFLTADLVEEAKEDARRLIDALLPFARDGIPIIGLEPSCLLTLRDEIPALLPGQETDLLSKHARMLEEFIADQDDNPDFALPLASPAPKVLLHGHCHQKAMRVMSSIKKTLARLPDTQVDVVETGCCGMAGAFDYGVETHEVSRKMAELDLAPAVRAANCATLVVADGTSCRHQIADLTDRKPIHIARLLERALQR